jgi:hypothetical protein
VGPGPGLERESAYFVLVIIPQEKRPLGRPGRRRDVIIKMALKEILWECVHWLNDMIYIYIYIYI